MTFDPKFAEWLKFQTFGEPVLERAVMACKEWAHALDKDQHPRWLTLIGECGTGKTHLCNRLWEWSKDHAPVSRCDYIQRKVFWPDFVQRLRTGEYWLYRDDMKRWPVLYLDDIGAERDPSGFAAEELNTLLAMRMGKWTLLTSNKDIDALRKVDARIASRLIRAGNICVRLITKDFSTR